MFNIQNVWLFEIRQLLCRVLRCPFSTAPETFPSANALRGSGLGCQGCLQFKHQIGSELRVVVEEAIQFC